MRWDDLAYFLAIARHKALVPAAAALGVSASTLSRRLTAFEHDIDRRLFHRGARGYELTGEGAELAAVAEGIELSMSDVGRWLDRTRHVRRVKISAGDWTMRLLLAHLHEFREPDAEWIPDFAGSNARLDLARREIDIGVRNRRPEEPWLAGRRIGSVEYAVYTGVGAADDLPWIGMIDPDYPGKTVRWTELNHGNDIGMRVSSPDLGLPLLIAGQGRMLLTTFIGDREPALRRIGGTVTELRSPQWLVVHHDERHVPPVRAALRAVAKTLETYT